MTDFIRRESPSNSVEALRTSWGTIMGLSLNSGIWIRDDRRLIKGTPDTDND